MRKTFRLVVSLLALFLGTGVLSPLIQANWQEWAKVHGQDQYFVQYAGPLMDKALTFAQAGWFIFLAGFFIGGAICLWSDRWLRQRTTSPISTPPPTLQAGLCVFDIRFNFAHLKELRGEWSMRVFNGTGRIVEFCGLSGRIKFRTPNNADLSRRPPGISTPLTGELPEPSARANMAQTVAPFKEELVILSQQVPSAEADKLLVALAADIPIHFDLSGLTIKVCAQNARQKIERLPIWGGVSYNRGFGFGQIASAIAHMGMKLT